MFGNLPRRRAACSAANFGAVAGGKDPANERKSAALHAKRKALTLGALIGQWDKLHLSSKRPNTASNEKLATEIAFRWRMDPAKGEPKCPSAKTLSRFVAKLRD